MEQVNIIGLFFFSSPTLFTLFDIFQFWAQVLDTVCTPFCFAGRMFGSLFRFILSFIGMSTPRSAFILYKERAIV